MRRIAADLSTDRKRRAARWFLAAVAHEGFPSDIGTPEYVQRELGRELSQRLIGALAGYPCFGCQVGYEVCGRCRGSGFSEGAQACDACAGMGQVRCDFCNGSGLATYNVIPMGLRREVMSRRVSRAIGLIERLASETPASAEGLRRLVLRLNKLLGVLENAVIQARAMIGSGEADAGAFDAIARRIGKAGARAEDQIRAALRGLSRIYLARESGPHSADDAAAAAFFRGLADTDDFRGTGLEHFFLHPHRHGRTAQIQKQSAEEAARREQEVIKDADRQEDTSSGEEPAT